MNEKVLSRRLQVFVAQSYVGELTEVQGLWSFTYNPEWTARPDCFPLAPGLPFQKETILDTGSNRPVQWYFDNLLPEEGARSLLAKSIEVDQADAFALLQTYGNESAGSLILANDRPPVREDSVVELTDKSLAARIDKLPRLPLTADAPKRMSVAGARHKLLVVVREGQLYEPVGATPSTHILKPNEPSTLFPHSVINEYFTMRLAQRLGMEVPRVERRYVPNPVYVIERFDRKLVDGQMERLHAIDACQLLNLDRQFKYTAASLERLSDIANRCSNRAAARIRLYRWLVFNILVGNSDAHLKNLSFLVDQHGIHIAPHYDLVATGVYDSKAFSQDATWPHVALPWGLESCRSFSEVNNEALLHAARVLGVVPETALRILRRQVDQIEAVADAVIQEIERENEFLLRGGEVVAASFAGELRLLRAIQHVVVREMAGRLKAAPHRRSLVERQREH